MLSDLNKSELKHQLNDLFDLVFKQLSSDSDIDKFLDNTLLFEEWEKVLPEAEYPIFIISVLNNIRRPLILNTIINSIVDKDNYFLKKKEAKSKNKKNENFLGEHPFS